MTFARALLAAAVLAVGLAACNTSDLPPAEQFGTLTGVVQDQSSGKPIAGAIVTVDAILTATTDATGKFTIDEVPVGDFDYTVTAQGYIPVSASALIQTGKPTPLDLNLNVLTATATATPSDS